MDRDLWNLDSYASFLEARREFLADAANSLLDELYGRAGRTGHAGAQEVRPETTIPRVPGGVTDESEEQALNDCRAWMKANGLPEGEYEYELTDRDTGDPQAILDLACRTEFRKG